MTNNYSFRVGDKDVVVTREKIAAFSESLHVNEGLKSRISSYFFLNLYMFLVKFGINPEMIIEEINSLEGDCSTKTKPATEFTRPPLKGLWHKHFFCPQFIAKNIQIGLGKNGLDKLITEVIDESDNQEFTADDLRKIARKVTREPIECRASSETLTGEWIVFAKEGGRNHYLCLSTHDAGDQNIANLVKENCFEEFGFLGEIMV